jgi:hypothetical protein
METRMARHLFLVAHHEPGLYEYLLERFQGDSNVEVILDRRREQRRRRSERGGPDRRRVDRRIRREVDLELLVRSHVILTLGGNGGSPSS